MVLYNKDYITDTIKMKADVLKMLPPDYIFIDYEYNIKNVALSTFHRDVTSSQKIFNTRYPTYTLILYKTDDDMLSVCPNSHKSYPFVWSNIININELLLNVNLLKKNKTNKKTEIIKGDKLRKKLNIVTNYTFFGIKNGLLIEEIK